MKIYYKIEHAHKCSEPKWIRSLYKGKPSEFDSLVGSWAALADDKLYPKTLQYRIVRVAEEVVDYYGGKTDNKPKEAPSLV